MRLMGRGGTSLPGKLAMKVSPDLLGELSRNVATIIVTGTNGKTTTTRMMGQCLSDAGIDYFTNKTGANLMSGILTEFCMNSSPAGKPKRKYALIECDEAAFRQTGKYLNAKLVLVTNVFRDQLDRFGEVTHTLSCLRDGIDDSKNAIICLNADCSLSVSLADGLDREIIYHGSNIPLSEKSIPEVSDATQCIRCKGNYTYTYRTYGHLGGFRCEKCGFQRPNPFVAVVEVVKLDQLQSDVVIEIDGKAYPFSINLPGGYNIYNAAGTVAAAYKLGISSEVIQSALSTFKGGFGRMESFFVNEKRYQIILVKNPAGCNQVLTYLAEIDTPIALVICLNDLFADGTDTSWIWDVNFEMLEALDCLESLYISGTRADEMALRLKYAGVPLEKMTVEKESSKLLDRLGEQSSDVYIVPTYTAMLELRDIICKKYGLDNFWE